MASKRCGCASDSCSCVITAGTGVEVSGTGSRTNPYVLDAPGQAQDSGWRDVSSLLINGWYLLPQQGEYVGALEIRRIGWQVWLAAEWLEGDLSTKGTFMLQPPGFKCSAISNYYLIGPYNQSNAGVDRTIIGADGPLYVNQPGGGQALWCYTNPPQTSFEFEWSFCYPTSDPWPSTLPGVPAQPPVPYAPWVARDAEDGFPRRRRPFEEGEGDA